MIARLAAGAVLVWLFSFLGFAFALPGPAEDIKTDAVVVPTGSDGRIARAHGAHHRARGHRGHNGHTR